MRDHESIARQTASQGGHRAGGLIVGVTSFFRDPAAWSALREPIARLLSDKLEGETVRAWVAGCSTGEEAYSLAMLLQEQVVESKQALRVQIFATDVNATAIEAARSGAYGGAIAKDVTPSRLARWFTPRGGRLEVRNEIRRGIVFSRHDLKQDLPFTNVDIVLCRNVLSYLDAEMQRSVLSGFQRALRPNGLLLIGQQESVRSGTTGFQPVDETSRIFRNARAVSESVASLPEDVHERLQHAEAALSFSNDALRSMAQELDASTADYRFTNRALDSANFDQERTIKELVHANIEMSTRLEATGVAVVFLDGDLHVRGFTTAACPIIPLLASDIGRPIGDLVPKIAYEHLVEDAREALRTAVVKEVHLPATTGPSYLVNVRPCRLHDDAVDGVVLTFVNVSSLHRG